MTISDHYPCAIYKHVSSYSSSSPSGANSPLHVRADPISKKKCGVFTGIDEETRRLERCERLYEEQQKRTNEDSKRVINQAHRKKAVLKTEVEVIDLTGD